MAQAYQFGGAKLEIPGSYFQYSVNATAGGLAANGYVALVGEADAGPDYTLEAKISDNIFGPDQANEVAAKYGSGRLVDAFNALIAAANDPQITGSISGAYLVKTNVSGKATSNLTNTAAGTYAALSSASYGKLGNLVYWNTSTATQELVPTTGSFNIAVPTTNIAFSVRANGGAKFSATLSSGAMPSAMVSAINAVSSTPVVASGGVDRTTIQSVAGNLSVAATGNSIVVTITTSWAVTPTVGDLLWISSSSAIKGGSSQNAGSYVVTAATSTTITATKVQDASGTVGTVTAPITVSAQAVASTTADVRCYSPISLTLTGTADNQSNKGVVIDGVGKTLEVIDSSGNLSLTTWTAAATPALVTWYSTSSAPYILVSSQEYSTTLNVTRQYDSTSESMTAGGQIAMQVSYLGTTATMTISTTTLTTSVTGGSGANLSLTLKDYPTVADLVAKINATTGYSAKVGSNAAGSFLSTTLDEVSGVGICTEYNQGASAYSKLNGRIKVDATKFMAAIGSTSTTVALGTNPTCGLPVSDIGSVVTTALPHYLTGGTKGGSTNANVTGAIDALQSVKTLNFIVPLFSRDATDDIADALTESTSTYTIDTINAYAKSHVLAMSTLKRKKNRQAIVSKRTTFASAKDQAQSLASFRSSCTFQDFSVATTKNGIVQSQPWMGAVLAAGMSAAAFYKGIVKKGINCTKVIQAAGDFNDQLDSNEESALEAGLLFARAADGGGFEWVSDQTTYSKDDNFVFNSIQAIYMADTIGQTVQQRMEKSFVGQSVADIGAAQVKSAMIKIFDDLFDLKVIARSDDAPRGFKNLSIKLSGGTVLVTFEAKVAGLIYFIPVSFTLSQVTQTASA